MLRCWDLAEASRSYRVSSPSAREDEEVCPIVHGRYDGHVVVLEEMLGVSELKNRPRTNCDGLTYADTCHFDAILAMAAVQTPPTEGVGALVVTADRAGVIKVWA